MSCFQNILVGIDLSHCAQLAPSALPAVAQELFRRSVWLAQKTSGSLTFFSALNVTEEVLLMLEEKHRIVVFRKIEDEAALILTEFVRKANENGVPAQAVFVRGQGWLEIIRQVLRGGHDLVMVGIRDSAGAGHRLFGNTGKKVLRRCPAPVWVCRPEPYDRPLNVLVASDLRPVSDTALRLAVGLGKAASAAIHVLYAIEYPVYHLWLTGLPDEVGREYHHRAVAQAEAALHNQLERTEHRSLSEPVRVHIADKVGAADQVILQCIREYQIDLVVLGTVGRAGAPGITIGNTAERLLAEVRCSVLAIKPPGFHCSVGVK
ncbi:MAG: universal stress protein [Isosphaeraceae bacterium]